MYSIGAQISFLCIAFKNADITQIKYVHMHAVHVESAYICLTVRLLFFSKLFSIVMFPCVLNPVLSCPFLSCPVSSCCSVLRVYSQSFCFPRKHKRNTCFSEHLVLSPEKLGFLRSHQGYSQRFGRKPSLSRSRIF
jgi:hypothetical protein